jgi:hypothetical protein
MKILKSFLTHQEQLNSLSKVLIAINTLSDKTENEEEIKIRLEAALTLTKELKKLNKEQIKSCGIDQLLK